MVFLGGGGGGGEGGVLPASPIPWLRTWNSFFIEHVRTVSFETATEYILGNSVRNEKLHVI